MTLHVSLFYAHKASCDARSVEAEMRHVGAKIAAIYKAKSGGAPVTVKLTPGKRVWDEKFGDSNIFRFGAKAYQERMNNAWEEWASSVPDFKDSTTGQIRFNIFVCPDEFVGKATARIIECALVANRACFYWDRAHDKLRRITWVLCHDPNDYKTGHRLCFVVPEEGGSK